MWLFDSFWIGNEYVGIYCEFRGSIYSGLLLNLYCLVYLESWFNGGKGGFVIWKEVDGVKVVVYSGECMFEVGSFIIFDFVMIIILVKMLDMKS